MADTGFRFNLGKFEYLIVSDGTILVPDPPSKNAAGNTGEQTGQNLDILCLFIDTGKYKILVDTGCGEGFQSGVGKLAQNLKAEGISCDEIDSIIFTHGHLDHVGGSFDAKGNPVFPRARYFISKKEWECWVTRPERKQLQPMFAAARKNFLPIPEQVTLVEDDTEALPGVKLLSAPGHSPGNIALLLSSGDAQLLCIGDMIHSSIEFNQPKYYAFLDTDPEQAVSNRIQILSQAAKSGLLVFACHFDFPGLGRILQTGDTLSWQPIKGKI